MKSEYTIGQRVILSRECSCLAGTIFEKGQEVTINEIDPVRGYGFIDDDNNRIIECGWDCIERAVEETTEEISKENSSEVTEEELKDAKNVALEIFNAMASQSSIKQVLSRKFSEKDVQFILDGMKKAFETGFDCCIEYVVDKED